MSDGKNVNDDELSVLYALPAVLTISGGQPWPPPHATTPSHFQSTGVRMRAASTGCANPYWSINFDQCRA